jgi:hypothetical protein
VDVEHRRRTLHDQLAGPLAFAHNCSPIKNRPVGIFSYIARIVNPSQDRAVSGIMQRIAEQRLAD